VRGASSAQGVGDEQYFVNGRTTHVALAVATVSQLIERPINIAQRGLDSAN
jgi:hypothetical protein